MVFELVSQNVLTFHNYFLPVDHVHIPINLIKKIIKDTLIALDHMHKLNIIHTDLKLENVMANRPLWPYNHFVGDEGSPVFHCLEDDPASVIFKLGDIGNSCFGDDENNGLIQTREYRSPEVILDLGYDTSADIWSLACMAYELAAKQYLFSPRDGLDDASVEWDGPKEDALHLSMIEKTIGKIPIEWAREGSKFQRLYLDGELIMQEEGGPTDVLERLVEAGRSRDEAVELARFLVPMLAIIPSRRPSAEEMLLDPWLH
jgi:serine/threonine protein kinase